MLLPLALLTALLSVVVLKYLRIAQVRDEEILGLAEKNRNMKKHNVRFCSSFQVPQNHLPRRCFRNGGGAVPRKGCNDIRPEAKYKLQTSKRFRQKQQQLII